MSQARIIASRLVLAYMALQVLSGWLIMFAIAWCLLEIWRGPQCARTRSGEAGGEPVPQRAAEPLALDLQTVEVVDGFDDHAPLAAVEAALEALEADDLRRAVVALT